ncbi:MAG: SRPBCC family protein [Acidimicrobiales bacterium]
MDVDRNIEIKASPQRVWDVHVDVESWPSWPESMSEVRRLDSGPLQQCSKVRISRYARKARVRRIIKEDRELLERLAR